MAGHIHLATAAWKVNLTAKTLRSFTFSNGQACGVYRWSCEKLNSWGKAGPKG